MRKVVCLAAVLLTLLFIQFCFAGSAGASADSAGIDLLKEKDALLDDIIGIIYRYHVDKPSLETLVNGAVEGMLEALEDPYTNYYPPEKAKDFFNAIEGNYEGIGVLIELRDGYPVAVEVFENSPAQKAGMKNEDMIVRVDGVDTKGLPLGKVAEMLRGPEGSKVKVTVRRGGREGGEEREENELVVVRAPVSAPSVSSELLDNDVGHIIIHSFNSHTAAEFYKALLDLQAKKISGLILDLRGNPGGMLRAAVDVAGSFIQPGEPVVTTVDRFGSKEIFRARAAVSSGDIKLAVLVDENSASASEILAGALQDYGRAVLVGKKTFGKGVVQWLLPLKEGGVLQVTVQKYYTPNGICIHGNGLTPDRRVVTTALQIPAAVQEIKSPGRFEVRMRVGSGEAVVNGIRVDMSQTMETPGKSVKNKTPGMSGKRFATGTPFTDGESIYLPLRFSLEALGCEVEWLNDIRAVRVLSGADEVVFPVQRPEAALNGLKVEVEKPVLLAGGLTYIPVGDLELLGIKVQLENTNIIMERIVN